MTSRCSSGAVHIFGPVLRAFSGRLFGVGVQKPLSLAFSAHRDFDVVAFLHVNRLAA
jgi:hypothetical protein